MSFQEMKRFNFGRFVNNEKKAALLNQILFCVSSARNAVVLVGSSIAAYYVNSSYGKNVISMTSEILLANI
jgi:hypothetical protein